MREIKYRAWLPPTPGESVGIMRQVRKIEWVNGGHLVTLEKNLITNIYTLMQYIGLKDKNGVEIYEGDIVTFQENVYSNGTKVSVSKRTVVEYDSTGRAGFKPFCEDWDYDGMSFLDTYGECAVIGNIYENPDLLEANQ